MGRRLIFGVGILAVAWMFGIVGLISGSRKESPLIAPSASAGRQALEAVLWDLKRNWRAHNRGMILEGIVTQADRLKPPLVELLSDGSGALLAEAIELAAILNVVDARPAIARIAEEGEERLRPRAVAVAEQFAPWTPEELGKFMKTGTPPVIFAALEVSSSREDRPFAAILSLFGHDAAQVRQAAADAMPVQLSPEDQEELLGFARYASEDQALYAIRSMGQSEIPPAVEAFLVEQMEYPVRSIRMAALDALTHKRSPLRHATAVWKYVREGYVDVKERAKAFVCLERTKSYEVFEIRDELSNLDPYLRYFAARCLVSAGEREGVGILIDLVEYGADRIGTVDQNDAKAVVFAARKLLADLSKIGISARVDELRKWYDSLEVLRPTVLQPAAIEF